MAFRYAEHVLRFLEKFRENRPQVNLYALLDCARDERIYPGIRSAGIRHRCLYTGHELLYWGNMPEVLAAAAPHIVRIKTDNPFSRWLIKDGWGDHWGIYLASEAGLDDLLRHFRRFVMTRDESGRPFYFRFYDPRVFRPYLPTCNEGELEMIFGPVERFVVEDRDPNTWIMYTFENLELLQRRFSIGGPTHDRRSGSGTV